MAMRLLATATRVAPMVGRQGSALRAVVPVSAASAAVPTRTWFGFGMAKGADEINAEGQEDKAVWSLEAVDDSAEYLVGPDQWTASERSDREALAKEVHAMASATPQVPADHAFYAKMFDLLIKYDDWRGVIAARDIGPEGNIEFSPELAEKIKTYLEDAEERSYHQGGNW
eukprot:m.413664 g.413664  ORF g.413664 m.413664 type:complete len:171 (+) comp29146_c0_seq1:47-559(+)